MADLDADTVENFEKRFDRGAKDECWEWQGSYIGAGYGSFKIDGKTIGAHRVMARLELDAALPLWPGRHSEYQVLHHCDNPSCVNPNHLYIGNTSDNMQDAHARGENTPGDLPDCTCRDEDADTVCPMHGDRDGENNPNAALTQEQADEIRERYESEDTSYRDLAGDYPCSSNTVGRIVRGEGGY